MVEEERELGIEAHIVEIMRTPSMDPARLGKVDVTVIFEIRPGEYDTIVIPEEEFDEERLKEEIKKAIEFRERWRGRRLRV